MSSDSWNDRRKAQEEEYFAKQNREALARLNARTGETRKSPITGEAMQQMTLMGVVVDRCPTSGGIWLDKGELELIIKAAHEKAKDGEGWLQGFFSGLYKKG